MYDLLWLIIASSSTAEFTRATYNNQQRLKETSIFRECTFRDCQSSGPGGALYLCDRFVALILAGCLFTNCRGGAVSAVDGLSFSMHDTSALSCSARKTGGFASVSVHNAIQVHQSAVSVCAARADSLALNYIDAVPGAPPSLNSLNSSSNWAAQRASAVRLGRHFGVSLRFCSFARNRPANCLSVRTDGDLSFVRICNNSCKSTAERGLLSIGTASLTASDCIFADNIFDSFFGGDGGRIEFHRCAADFAMPNVAVLAKIDWRRPNANVTRSRSKSPLGTGGQHPTGETSPGEADVNPAAILAVQIAVLGVTGIVLIVAGGYALASLPVCQPAEERENPLAEPFDLAEHSSGSSANADKRYWDLVADMDHPEHKS